MVPEPLPPPRSPDMPGRRAAVGCRRCRHQLAPTPRPAPPAQEEEARKAEDKAAIEREAALLAFDRQNHAGASEGLTARLKQAIGEEAEALLADKRTAAGAVNIREHEERMKARRALEREGEGLCTIGAGGARPAAPAAGPTPSAPGAPALQEMRAFWLPSKTPEAKALLERPSMETLCPASGAPAPTLRAVSPQPGNRDPALPSSDLYLLPPPRQASEAQRPCARAVHARARRWALRLHGPSDPRPLHQRQPPRSAQAHGCAQAHFLFQFLFGWRALAVDGAVRDSAPPTHHRRCHH